MKKILLPTPLRPRLLRRMIELAVLIVLLAGSLVAHTYVKADRRQLITQQASQSQEPEAALKQASLQYELREQTQGLAELNTVLISPDQIGDFIGHLEQTAARHDVRLSIPTVKEARRTDARGKVIPSSGPLIDIGLSIVAVGTPPALLNFVHDVELAPYLVTFTEWEVNTTASTPLGFSATEPAAAPAAEEETTAVPAVSVLNAEAILSVKNDRSP